MGAPATEERVKLHAPDGSKVTVPASELQTALQSGYTQASAEEVAAEEERKHYTETTEQVKAGAEGLLRGTTFGLSDAAATATGLSDASDMRKRKEYNPGIALGSEIVGGVAPLLIPGAGVAAGVARGAGFMPRAVAGLGTAVEHGVAKAVGKGVLGRAASLGASGAVEGALVGGGMAVSDAALQDTELTGEMVVAGMGQGALMGAAAGGVMGAGIGTLAKGAAAAGAGARAAAKGAKGLLPDSAAARLLDDAVPVGAADELLPAGALDDVVPTPDALEGTPMESGLQTFNRRSKAHEELTDVQHKRAVEMDRVVTERAELGDELRDSLDQNAKYKSAEEGFAADVAAGRVTRTSAEAAALVDDIADDALREVTEIAGKRKGRQAAGKLQSKIKTAKGDRAAIKGDGKKAEAARARSDAKIAKLQRQVDDLGSPEEVFEGVAFTPQEANAARRFKEGFLDEQVAKIRKLREAAEAGEEVRPALFREADVLKREFGRFQGILGGRGTQGAGDVLFTAGGIARKQYDDLIPVLEDPSLFGDAAAVIQAQDNAHWVPMLDVADGFRETMLKGGSGRGGKRIQTGSSAGWHQSDIADASKIDALTFSAGNPGAAPLARERMIKEGAETEAALWEQLLNSRSVVASPETKAKVARFRELTDNLVGAYDQAKATSIAAREHKEWLDKWSGVPLAETVTRTVSTLAEKARMLAGMQTKAAGVSSKLDKAVKAAVSGTKKAAKKAGAKAKTVAKQSAAKSRRERFDTAADGVKAANRDPVAMGEQIAARVGDHRVASSVVGTVVRGNAFLQSKLPAPLIRDSDRQPHLDGTQRVASSEMAKWLRYSDAVKDPMSVVRALEAGDMTREGAEALRTVYPKMYASLKDRVTDQIAESKEVVPRSQLVQLSILFDEPYHYSMEPGFMASMQRLGASDAADESRKQSFIAPSARKAPDTASEMMTTTQRLSQ